MIYLELLVGFLKVGLFSFGGAYGAIPLIRDVVLGYGWLDEDALVRMIAVGESTPGPIMVNLATYVGRSQAGLAGALIATAAVVLPSFVVILLVMTLMRKLLRDPHAQAVLRGLKPCVVGIVLATGVYMTWRHCAGGDGVRANLTATAMTALLAGVHFGSRKLWKGGLSPVGLILLSALLGIAFYGWR